MPLHPDGPSRRQSRSVLVTPFSMQTYGAFRMRGQSPTTISTRSKYAPQMHACHSLESWPMAERRSRSKPILHLTRNGQFPRSVVLNRDRPASHRPIRGPLHTSRVQPHLFRFIHGTQPVHRTYGPLALQILTRQSMRTLFRSARSRPSSTQRHASYQQTCRDHPRVIPLCQCNRSTHRRCVHVILVPTSESQGCRFFLRRNAY